MKRAAWQGMAWGTGEAVGEQSSQSVCCRFTHGWQCMEGCIRASRPPCIQRIAGYSTHGTRGKGKPSPMHMRDMAVCGSVRIRGCGGKDKKGLGLHQPQARRYRFRLDYCSCLMGSCGCRRASSSSCCMMRKMARQWTLRIGQDDANYVTAIIVGCRRQQDDAAKAAPHRGFARAKFMPAPPA